MCIHGASPATVEITPQVSCEALARNGRKGPCRRGPRGSAPGRREDPGWFLGVLPTVALTGPRPDVLLAPQNRERSKARTGSEPGSLVAARNTMLAVEGAFTSQKVRALGLVGASGRRVWGREPYHMELVLMSCGPL
jgi:hypothetical protein